jgi:diaminopimelate epimerase
LTYFCGNAARVVAAYLAASKEYVDQVENTENPIETLHKDVIYGAKLLLNEANRKG